MKNTKFYLTPIVLLFIFNTIQAQVHYVSTTTNDTTSTAIGYKTTATGAMSFASGIISTASGVGSITLGQFNESVGDYSVTLGRFLKATNGTSMIIGSGFSDNLKMENHNTYSLMIGFLSQYPTLFVGTSPSYDKTGRIGIGNVTEPEAKLHLRADEGEEAAIFIEPNNWENGDTAKLYIGNKANGISAENEDGMIYNTGNRHIFKGGDVYIEDIDKGIIMKSPDGKCWRGTLNNNGFLEFTRLESCPGQTATVKEHSNNNGNNLELYPNPAGDFITVSFKDSKKQQKTIKLISVNGSYLLTKNISGNSTRFYIGDLPPGTYFVQVITGNKNVSKKFIKK